MEIADVEVRLNNEAAKNRIKELTAEMEQLKAMRDKAFKDGDSKSYDRLNRELQKTGREAKKVEKELFDVNTVLRNLSGTSAPDLSKALRKLQADHRALNRESNTYTQDSAKLKQSMSKVRSELDKVNITMYKQQSLFKRVSGSFNQYFGMAAAAVATFTGTVLSIRKAAQVYNDYEESLDSLQSLTGLTAEKMAFLDEQAKKTSTSVLQGGIRIKQSANEILDAYTIIGSQRPELLKNADALHEVTIEAITLAEAAKMELAPAAAALTNTMNQFQVGASEARRIINSLAAGSQAGAGNIEYLSQAIEKSGTTANLMNISIEQNIGLIESMAPFYKEASMAGNSLDKVLLKLKTNGIGFTNGVFDMNDAIDELRFKYANGTSAADIFGVEHAKMGELLVQNQAEFNRYTVMVTGSNKAIEQAAGNTDNNNAKLAQAKNRLNLLTMELGQKLAPALTISTNKFSYFVKWLLASIQFLNDHRRIIIVTTTAIAAYTITVNASAIAYKLLGVWIRIADTAQKAFNVTTKMSPLAWVATLLATAAAAYLVYKDKIKYTTKEQISLNKELERSNDLMHGTQSLEQKAKVMHTMNKRQLEDYKLTLNSQLNAEEDYRTNLMSTVKKRLDEDSELQRLYAIRDAGYKTDMQRINIESQINFRKRALTGEYEDIAKSNRLRMDQLKTFITDVDTTIKAKLSGKENSNYETQLKQLETNQAKQQELTKKNYAEGKITKLENEATLLGLDAKFYANKIALQSKYGKDSTDTEEKLTDTLIKIRERQDSYLAETQELADKAKKIIANIESEIASAADTETNMALEEDKEQLEDLKKQLADYEEAQNNLQQNDLTGSSPFEKLKQQYESERTIIEENYAAGLISREQYETAITALATQYNKGRLQIVGDYFQQVGDISYQTSNLVQTLQDAEVASIETKVEKGIISTEEGEAQKKKIYKKYADFQFVAKASQIIADTAVAVIRTLAELGPIAGPLMATFIGLTGAAQLKIANQERQKMKGYYYGGYTGMGSDTSQAGTVHSNEYVTPAWMVRNPQIAPTIAKLEQVRQNPTMLHEVNASTTLNADAFNEAVALFKHVATNIRAKVDYLDIEEKSKEMDYIKNLNK